MKAFDDCSFCGGRVHTRRVQKVCTWGGRLVAVVDDVPAGVCEQCGERYYPAPVLKAVERLLAKKQRAARQIRVPLMHFAKA